MWCLSPYLPSAVQSPVRKVKWLKKIGEAIALLIIVGNETVAAENLRVNVICEEDISDNRTLGAGGRSGSGYKRIEQPLR